MSDYCCYLRIDGLLYTCDDHCWKLETIYYIYWNFLATNLKFFYTDYLTQSKWNKPHPQIISAACTCANILMVVAKISTVNVYCKSRLNASTYTVLWNLLKSSTILLCSEATLHYLWSNTYNYFTFIPARTAKRVQCAYECVSVVIVPTLKLYQLPGSPWNYGKYLWKYNLGVKY